MPHDDYPCLMVSSLKAAAHRLATAIENLQSSNDLRLQFQRQNQAAMHTARERLRCDRCVVRGGGALGPCPPLFDEA